MVRPAFHPFLRKLPTRAPRPKAKTQRCLSATGQSTIPTLSPPHLRGTWPRSSKKLISLPATTPTFAKMCWIPFEKHMQCCRSSSPSVEQLETICPATTPRRAPSTRSPRASLPRPAPSSRAHRRIGVHNWSTCAARERGRFWGTRQRIYDAQVQGATPAYPPRTATQMLTGRSLRRTMSYVQRTRFHKIRRGEHLPPEPNVGRTIRMVGGPHRPEMNGDQWRKWHAKSARTRQTSRPELLMESTVRRRVMAMSLQTMLRRALRPSLSSARTTGTCWCDSPTGRATRTSTICQVQCSWHCSGRTASIARRAAPVRTPGRRSRAGWCST